MPKYPDRAIVFGSIKAPLLYYDYVIPVNLFIDMLDSGKEDKQDLLNIVPDILPPELRTEVARESLGELNGAMSRATAKIYLETHKKEETQSRG